MPRITQDDLKYCVEFDECWDCYIKDRPPEAQEIPKSREPLLRQQRGNLQVPCCQKHFKEYERKVKEASDSKYKRRKARRAKAGLCVSHGCNKNLIPPELLPFWRRGESTCGIHGKSNPPWLNRLAIIKLIMDHCLTPEQRKVARPQNVIYKRGSELVFVRIQYPNYSATEIWATSVLKRLYKKFHSKKAPDSAAAGATQ